MSERPYRVLLAEDNPADVYLVKTALAEAGLDVELSVLADGDEVLAFLGRVEQQHDLCPDILLLDLNMPKRTGEEILGHMRDSSTCNAVPVVVLTSSSRPRDRERAMALGVVEYFCKPPDYDEFMKMGPIVRTLLRKPAQS